MSFALRFLALSALLALLSATNIAHAHSDHLLTLQPDGRLSEIPARFGRASLDVRWSGDGPTRLKLSIGPRTYTVPACIRDLIRTRDARDLQLSASWYPEGQRSAYYVNMVFYAPGTQHDQAGGKYVELTFDLFTAELKRVWVQRSWFLGFGVRLDRNTPRDYCSEAELKAAARAI